MEKIKNNCMRDDEIRAYEEECKETYVPKKYTKYAGKELLYHTGGYKLLDRFDNYIVNMTSTALDGIIPVEKVYMLSDSDQVAPEPNQENYSYTSDPSTLQGFLDEAKELLGVEDTLFSTETQLYAGSQVITYLDETIMVITWQELIDATNTLANADRYGYVQ